GRKLDLLLAAALIEARDRKSTRLNSSHVEISYAVFCLKKKKKKNINTREEYAADNMETIGLVNIISSVSFEYVSIMTQLTTREQLHYLRRFREVHLSYT